MTYDCRPQPAFGARRFPCRVRVERADTGERVPNVFFAATDTGLVGRWVAGADGRPLVGANGGRLEVWDYFPWRAVALDGGGVIARSEGLGPEDATAVGL